MEKIEGRYDYYAFISYKREDEGWAKWLQHKLEHYRLPSKLNGRTDLPREIRPAASLACSRKVVIYYST